MSTPGATGQARPEIDRRGSFRQDVIVPLDYFPEGIRADPVPKPTEVNLSVTGIRFATSRTFSVGDRLEIVLALPNASAVYATAEIVRIATDDMDHSSQAVGCRFVSMTSHSRERMTQFLLSSQAASLRASRSH